MTNKEIIERLKWVRKRISEITYSPESFEAINSAIEAVKKQDEILENNKDLCKHCEELKEENKMLSDVKENLEKKIEFLMQQIRLWQSWASTEQQGKDCAESPCNHERQKDNDLCETCRYYDVCELSTKMISDCRTTRCYKYEEGASKIEFKNICIYPTENENIYVFPTEMEADNETDN